MCRWLAYTGSPILLSEALYAPAHSLIDQSLHSRLGAEATNGDGFGIGWYDASPTPGIFRSIEPAWNDRNLHELAEHVSSGHFFAHVPYDPNRTPTCGCSRAVASEYAAPSASTSAWVSALPN